MRLFRGADLTYNVVEQSLKRKIGKTAVSAHAVSGGRAGSKKANATNNFLIIHLHHPAMMTRYGWGVVRAQA